MARTGYLVVIYQDINPSSPTYNQTREERTQSEEFCPTSAEANWIEDTKYCELTENGMLTGYEITVYRDVEPLSSTYNQTREEKELNLEECEADETTPNWQNIGDPFCRQKVYLPGGLMGNDGYMIQQQQDMNEYSETADEIRDVETLDLENCPLPNTEPVWQTISESCHLVTFNGQLVYDGTKDVIRVNTNQYSPSWNNNIPETANIEDEINCPSGIEKQYRWVAIGFSCVGYDKYEQLKKQESIDGVNWTDVVPLETMQGDLIERNSTDCGYIEPQYTWTKPVIICIGYDKYEQSREQVSYDGGNTWEDTGKTSETLIEANSADCGYEPTVETRWVVVDGQYECVGYDKHAVEKKQQRIDGGSWTDVTPTETRTGSVIEYNSEDCGYVPPTPGGYENQYLTFEALEDGTFSFTNAVQYTIDNGATWTTLNANTASPTVTRGNKIMWKAEITPSWPSGVGTFSSTGRYNVEGNPMSLLFGDNFKGKTDLTGKNYALYGLFKDDSNVINAKNLSLPATTLANRCYNSMFWGCTSLVNTPALPATTLAESCYGNMFYGCSNLTTAPALPATTLAKNCYFSMFDSCKNLTTAPELPATTLADYCYEQMFASCTNLTTAPELPATTLAERCYASMFLECRSLVKAPELPATNFTNISDTPASNGYEYMQMFANCTSLVYLKAMFVDYGYLNVYNWMINIKTKGTFVKNPNATWTDAPQIPSTWTVVTE